MRTKLCLCGVCSLMIGLAACSDDAAPPSSSDAGSDAGVDAQVNADAGGSLLSPTFFPAPAPAFTSTTNTPGSVQVSISGEDLAQLGFEYSATPTEGEPVFVDGWAIDFDHVYLVVAGAKLNEMGADPDMRTVLGAQVARREGLFLVDLAKSGPITGAGGAPETAIPLFVFNGPDGGGSFSTSTRYAFTWETAVATGAVSNINLVEADRANAEEMIRRQWSIYIVGTATYEGRAATASVDPTFQTYPTSVDIRLGFGAPARYVNCHNPELGADPEDPSFWGIQPNAGEARRAQISWHLDHGFWTTLEEEGTPLFFDPFAARSSNFGVAGDHVVTMADLMGVDPAALEDRAGNPVGDRGAQTAGYSPLNPPPGYDRNGVGSSEVADFRDFVANLARGGGHMNADGECEVEGTAAYTY